MSVGICTSGTYCLLLLPSTEEIFHFKQRLIDDVVGFSTIPAARDGTLTHLLYVSLVSSQMETVSKICRFEIGQYHLALPKMKPMNTCSEAFYLFRPKKKPRESYQPIILWASISRPISSLFGDIFGSTYIFRKLMMSSMS